MRAWVVSACCAVALAGCTVKVNEKDNLSGDGGTSGSTLNNNGTGGTFSGNFGGTPFTLRSGFARVVSNNALDLVLSNQDGACASAQVNKLHPGETLVQLYSLKGAAPGTFVSDTGDLKYATVASTCGSGSSVEGSVDHAGRATSSSITIQQIETNTVSGTLELSFDDGSVARGSFIVPTCPATIESSTCW